MTLQHSSAISNRFGSAAQCVIVLECSGPVGHPRSASAPVLLSVNNIPSRARRRTVLQLQSELINNYLRRHTSTDSGCSSHPAVAVETTAAVLRAEIGRWRGKE
ncbi:uncharacterized [Tachysurus ichikawai]